MFSSMFCGTFFMNSLAGITMQALLCHFVKPVTQLFKLHKLLYVFHTHGVSLPYPQATMFVCITLSDLYRGAPPPAQFRGSRLYSFVCSTWVRQLAGSCWHSSWDHWSIPVHLSPPDVDTEEWELTSVHWWGSKNAHNAFTVLNCTLYMGS